MSISRADNLLLFKSIVDCGSLSRAAIENNISVSQASKRMSYLENSLKTKLLNRTTRALSLTDAGEVLYSKLEVVKDALEKALQSVTHFKAMKDERVRVIAPQYYGINHLIGKVEGYKQANSEAKVELTLTDDGNNVETEGYDLYIYDYVLGLEEEPTAKSLSTKKIHSEPMVFVASEDYIEKHGLPTKPEELTQHKCLDISLNRGPWQFKLAEDTTSQDVTPIYKASTFDALCRAAKMGMGITLLPESYAAKYLHEDKLVRVFAEYETKSLATYACYRGDARSYQKVEKFLHTLAERV